MSRRFRLLALILTFVMLFAVTGVAQAHGSKDSKHYSKMFGDTAIEDCEWGFKYIEQLGTLGVIKGDEHGHFNGNATINHQEAVTMIVRYSGFEAEAIARAGESVHLLDGDKIATWARGYVNVALDRNLLWLPDSDNITTFSPTNPTTRLEAVVMMVKAAGSAAMAEAEGKKNSVLTFRDAHLIPSEFVGYVAYATEHQLVKGYNDNTFQPKKPVTRAEMATFLGRGIEQIPAISLGKSAEGTLTAVTATSLTLKVHGAEVLINVKTDAPVYRDDKPVALTQLVVGDKVEVKLDTTGTAVFIDAKHGDNDDDDDEDHGTPSGTTGTLKSITVYSSPALTLISITPTGGTTEQTYVLAANAVIKVNGTVKTVNDLVPGDSVTIKTGTAGSITELLATHTVATTVYTGVIKSVIPAGTITLATITLDGNGGEKSYTMAANCPVKIDNVSKTPANLMAGDKVSFKADTASMQITELTATRVTVTVYTGTVKSIVSAGNITVATITLDGNGGEKTYTFAANCPVKIDNVTKTPANLAAGDKVSFKADTASMQITELTATRVTATVYSGTIKSIITVGNITVATITLDGSTSEKLYTFATDCPVKIDNVTRAPANLLAGDKVTFKVDNTGEKITELTASRVTAIVHTGTVKSIVSVNTITVATITLDGNAGEKSYNFVANCPVKIDNVTKTPADLAIGDKVSFKTDATGDTITELTATRTVLISGTVSGVNYLHNLLTLSGSTHEYTVPTDAQIKFLGATVGFDQVALNDTVTLTLTNGVVTKVEVTVHNLTLSGTVKSVAEHSFVLTVGTADYTINVPATAVITENGGSGSFQSIVAGYTAAVTGTQSQAHAVTAAMITVNH